MQAMRVQLHFSPKGWMDASNGLVSMTVKLW